MTDVTYLDLYDDNTVDILVTGSNIAATLRDVVCHVDDEQKYTELVVAGAQIQAMSDSLMDSIQRRNRLREMARKTLADGEKRRANEAAIGTRVLEDVNLELASSGALRRELVRRGEACVTVRELVPMVPEARVYWQQVH